MRLVYAAASFTLNMARTCINVHTYRRFHRLRARVTRGCLADATRRDDDRLSKGKPFGRGSSPVCFCVYPARARTQSRFLPPRSDYKSARVHCTHAWLMAHRAQVIPPRDRCFSLTLPLHSLTLSVSLSLFRRHDSTCSTPFRLR